MKRHAFTMKLYEGFEEEYKKRHDEIWAELEIALKNAGISDYTIFIDPKTYTLFAVQKQSDNSTVIDLPQLPIVKKWWKYMSDIMDTNKDNSPVEGKLIEVFHMD